MSEALFTLANTVELYAAGDVSKILAVGFDTLADSSNAPIAMTQVLNLVLTAGDSEGEIDAAWDPVPAARVYDIQTSTDPNDPALWKTYDAPQSRSTLTLTGLTSGQKIWVRVRALGAGDQPSGAWSDPATKMTP